MLASFCWTRVLNRFVWRVVLARSLASRGTRGFWKGGGRGGKGLTGLCGDPTAPPGSGVDMGLLLSRSHKAWPERWQRTGRGARDMSAHRGCFSGWSNQGSLVGGCRIAWRGVGSGNAFMFLFRSGQRVRVRFRSSSCGKKKYNDHSTSRQ